MCSIPGSRMSSVKLLCPVRSVGSSLRGTLFPMYRRAISVMARPPSSSRNPLTSSSHFHCAPRSPLNLPEQPVSEVCPGILLVLYEKPGDDALFLSLDVVERFHDLDQADGISGRDLVALLDVGVALRIG